MKRIVVCSAGVLLALAMVACRSVAGYEPARRDLGSPPRDQSLDRLAADLSERDVTVDREPGCTQAGVSSLLRFSFDERWARATP